MNTLIQSSINKKKYYKNKVKEIEKIRRQSKKKKKNMKNLMIH